MICTYQSFTSVRPQEVKAKSIHFYDVQVHSARHNLLSSTSFCFPSFNKREMLALSVSIVCKNLGTGAPRSLVFLRDVQLRKGKDA